MTQFEEEEPKVSDYERWVQAQSDSRTFQTWERSSLLTKEAWRLGPHSSQSCPLHLICSAAIKWQKSLRLPPSLTHSQHSSRLSSPQSPVPSWARRSHPRRRWSGSRRRRGGPCRGAGRSRRASSRACSGASSPRRPGARKRKAARAKMAAATAAASPPVADAARARRDSTEDQDVGLR